MRKKLSFVLVLFASVLSAQNYLSSSSPDFHFNQAITLYQSGDYTAAKHLLDEYLKMEETPEALYYRAISAIKSEQKSGEHYVNSFVRDYPLHPLAYVAKFELAHEYFTRRNYSDALLTFASLDLNSLDNKQKELVYFEKGYSMLQMNIVTQGVESLKKANEFGGDYQHMSAYYLGIHTEGEEAEEWFKQAAEDEKWASKSGLYLSQIYLRSKEYEKLQAFSGPLLNTNKTIENRDLHLYTAESYYQQGDYRKASRIYNDALALNVRRPDAETLFKMGHAFYEIGEKQKAIDQLKLSGLNETPTGQASAFQLAKIYTELGQFTNALHAYDIAGASDHDEKIKEEAQFQAGKVSVQTEQFDQAITKLESFLGNYPASNKNSEANDLLSTSYLNSSNYDLIIEHFEKLSSTTSLQKRNYQQVCLIKGTQAFSDRKVDEAVTYLSKSLTTPINQKRKQEANYWLGECYTLLGDTEQAKKNYELAASGFPDANYGLGYLAYNSRDYGQAKTQFDTYISKVNGGSFYWDARLRSADCSYALKKYDQALASYQALDGKPVGQDYKDFQIGLIHQLNGRVDPAVNSYQKVTKNGASSYRDNALFQIAQTYFEDANFDMAIEAFDSYITQFPDENSAPYARLKRAQSHYNLANLDASKNDYLFVLDNHISHLAARDALVGVQELQKSGVLLDFDKYLAMYSDAHPDDSSLASIEFEQAKTLYFNGQYQSAIQRLNTLLEKDAESPFKEDIIYYLGDAHDKSGDLRQANVYYEKIIGMAPSKYLNRVLDKRGKLLLTLEDGQKATENYQMLKASAKNRKEAYLATEGLMKSSFLLSDFNACIAYGREIENAEWKPSNAESEAYLFMGKSMLNLKDSVGAIDEFLKVINASTDELAAEAKYSIADVQYQQENYKGSLESLFQLNSKYGAYQEWIGESFLLIADNYIALEELLQAKATLNSLIENFPDPKVKDRAKAKIGEIDRLQLKETEQDTLR